MKRFGHKILKFEQENLIKKTCHASSTEWQSSCKKPKIFILIAIVVLKKPATFKHRFMQMPKIARP
jgi:hypothetical protein